jgi:REP-associated tyrosine transposase
VTLNGKDYYLGPHGTKASKAEYDRLLSWWLANGRNSEKGSPDGNAQLTISEMILRYWLFAKQHYRRDGHPTRELDNIRDALRPLRELFGSTLAAAFGPKALKTLRNKMIQTGLARSTINFRISKVRRAFRWAVENELVNPDVYQGLTAVPGLLPGRDGVRETRPVTTVPESHVVAVFPHVSGPIRAMIQIQSLTGMRPGEVTAMRGMDIDRSGLVRPKPTASGRATRRASSDPACIPPPKR